MLLAGHDLSAGIVETPRFKSNSSQLTPSASLVRVKLRVLFNHHRQMTITFFGSKEKISGWLGDLLNLSQHPAQHYTCQIWHLDMQLFAEIGRYFLRVKMGSNASILFHRQLGEVPKDVIFFWIDAVGARNGLEDSR